MCDQANMIKYINIAREYPAYYINLIDKQLQTFINEKEMPISEDMIYETNEGKKVWKEARQFLEMQNTLAPFQVHQGLNLSAKEHAVDLATHNIFGHTGSDKSSFSERILKYCKKEQGAMAEIIGADFFIEGRNSAEMTILGLIIDDGVADRGHRKTIFNSEYRFIGCKSEIQNDKVITVFNLTQNRLQMRGGQSTISYEGSRVNSSTSGCLNQLKIPSNQAYFSKTQTNNFKKKVPAKENQGKVTLDEISHNISHATSSMSPSNLLKSQLKGGKKVNEKKQNTRIYYEEGSKITQKYTQVFYSDGTMQENMQKHTVYS